MSNVEKHPQCPMRTVVGNCDAIGGFCTSVSEPVCEAFHKLYKQRQEWIPCSERLPSENDEYIITMGKDGFNKEGYVTWAMFDKLKKKFYFPGGRVNYYISVTAWMPKPKPWKRTDDA